MGGRDLPRLPLDWHPFRRHISNLVVTLADLVVHSRDMTKQMSQHVSHMVSLFLCCWIKFPLRYLSNSLSDAAARESIVSYHCLFALPPFVCFVKVLLSIIMNHVFFILFLFILMAGGRMWWLMRGWNELSLSLSPRAGAYLSISDGQPEGYSLAESAPRTATLTDHVFIGLLKDLYCVPHSLRACLSSVL